MKKLFLFIGVIMLCLLFSCKKDSSSSQPPPPPPPPIDSFLLHPPPVLDSLPIPLKIGTWWKYQRLDSSKAVMSGIIVKQIIDSSLELISVIGMSVIVNSAYDYSKSPYRIRYDSVNAFMLEVKNLTKGTVDTNYVEYYNSSFNYYANKNSIPLLVIMLPQIEGSIWFQNQNYMDGFMNKVIKDTSVSIFDKIYNGCIYTSIHGSTSNHNGKYNDSEYFLKQGVGFVYWKTDWMSWAYNSSQDDMFIRKLIDYHIAP